MNDVDCTMFKITLRSPDLNPVEDIFHVVWKHLDDQEIENDIHQETFNEFS